MPNQITLELASQQTDEQRKIGMLPSKFKMDYLPFGVSSLKIAVTGNYKGTIYVRPEEFSNESDPICGYASGEYGKEIQVSWGGGWEKGVEVEHQKGSKEFVHFNIRHQGDDKTREYKVNFVACDENGNELGNLNVVLSSPAAVLRLVPFWKDTDFGKDLILNPENNEDLSQVRVPVYVSRWWPEEQIQFASNRIAGKPPLIRLNCIRNVGKGNSEITVFAKKDDDKEKMIATIDGDIHFPLVDLQQIAVNLYFIAQHWGLRIWFFWIDKNLGKRLSGIKLTEEESLLKDWGIKQEIPDSERVDLIFNKNLQLVNLCTDLHWRELWAPWPDNKTGPVRISIAGTQLGKIIFRGGTQVFEIIKGQAQRYLPKRSAPFDPTPEVQKRLQNSKKAEMGPGEIRHKHTPFFHDVSFDSNLISSDVREG